MKNAVTIIGAGKLAYHLIKVFIENNILINEVFVRNELKAIELEKEFKVKTQSKISNLNKNSACYIIAVTDTEITKVAYQLDEILQNKLIAHTSGATPILENLKNNRAAVFYPLQSFTPTQNIQWDEVPILIETKNTNDYNLLINLTQNFTQNFHQVNSSQRAMIHVAAVFASNFANFMFVISQKIADQNNIDFNLFKPLIKNTIAKLETILPTEAQTGPALRNDETTINKHIELLQNNWHYSNLYKQISKLIQTEFKN